MDELEQRVKALETKVKILEETLETLKSMQLSEQMEGYIQSKNRELKMVDLVNSLSDKPMLDFNKENERVKKVQSEKNKLDDQISAALKYSGTFSEEYPDDPRYFNYEVEQGTTMGLHNKAIVDKELLKYAGKGLRITSYNGFESERIIVPKEIDGKPVISIGEKAFQNASFKEIILPKTIKVIMREAFRGCSNLKRICLPEGLEYLGSYCLSGCGLQSIVLPDSITKIPSNCFYWCKKLSNVVLGKKSQVLDEHAFASCTSIDKISLPETMQKINAGCFAETKINLLIFPSNVLTVSYDTFANDYDYTGNSRKVTCVFLGKETNIVSYYKTSYAFNYVNMIYCLPGSNIQKFAREHRIPMKPLSEFKPEGYGL